VARPLTAKAVATGLAEYAPDVPITFRRLADASEQTIELNLPRRPAKRFDREAAKFGDEAVELDTIAPDKLLALIEDAIVERIDDATWSKKRDYEQSERDLLALTAGAA